MSGLVSLSTAMPAPITETAADARIKHLGQQAWN
jgi:hypothetical protein